MSETDEIKVGNKPHKNYVTACIWAKNNSKDIKLLGRGSNITKLIDITEIIKRHYDIEIPDILEIKELLDNDKIEEAKQKLNDYCKVIIRFRSEEFNDKNISIADCIIKVN